LISAGAGVRQHPAPRDRAPHVRQQSPRSRPAPARAGGLRSNNITRLARVY